MNKILNIMLITPLLTGCGQPVKDLQKTSVLIEKKHKIKSLKRLTNQELLQQLRELNQTKDCQSSQHCSLIEIGHSPCGGPAEYWVKSALNNQLKRLTNLAKKYKQRIRQQQKQQGTVGICQIIPKPNYACQQRVCVLSSKSERYNR